MCAAYCYLIVVCVNEHLFSILQFNYLYSQCQDPGKQSTTSIAKNHKQSPTTIYLETCTSLYSKFVCVCNYRPYALNYFLLTVDILK